jgi:hypothetical protein
MFVSRLITTSRFKSIYTNSIRLAVIGQFGPYGDWTSEIDQRLTQSLPTFPTTVADASKPPSKLAAGVSRGPNVLATRMKAKKGNQI